MDSRVDVCVRAPLEFTMATPAEEEVIMSLFGELDLRVRESEYTRAVVIADKST